MNLSFQFNLIYLFKYEFIVPLKNILVIKKKNDEF